MRFAGRVRAKTGALGQKPKSRRQMLQALHQVVILAISKVRKDSKSLWNKLGKKGLWGD